MFLFWRIKSVPRRGARAPTTLTRNVEKVSVAGVGKSVLGRRNGVIKGFIAVTQDLGGRLAFAVFYPYGGVGLRHDALSGKKMTLLCLRRVPYAHYILIGKAKSNFH